MTASNQQDTHWLVIDTRTARDGIQSGVSRFVVGLSRALAEELEGVPGLKLLLVGKSEPPEWVVDLVHRHPHCVSFWSGGPGALTRRYEKPVYLWPSRVARRVSKLTQGRFHWIAPANFDRPLFCGAAFGNQQRERLVQIIHDTIPLVQRNSMGFLFRIQFRFFVKRTLLRINNVFTVSALSAQALQQLSPKRSHPVQVLTNGVDAVFGSIPLARSAEEKEKRRVALLRSLIPGWGTGAQAGLAEKLAAMRWVVGVGRYQKYKGWEVAEEAVAACNNQVPGGALFLRVGFDERELARFGRADVKTFGGAHYFPALPMLTLAPLADGSLAALYALADLLVHPSRAEGFGLPPLEAALSGCPVLFRAGTAVDGHFSPGVLPKECWNAVSSDSASEWAVAIRAALQVDASTSPFLTEVVGADRPREVVVRKAGCPRYDWRETARALLRHLGPSTSAVEAPR